MIANGKTVEEAFALIGEVVEGVPTATEIVDASRPVQITNAIVSCSGSNPRR